MLVFQHSSAYGTLLRLIEQHYPHCIHLGWQQGIPKYRTLSGQQVIYKGVLVFLQTVNIFGEHCDHVRSDDKVNYCLFNGTTCVYKRATVSLAACLSHGVHVRVATMIQTIYFIYTALSKGGCIT